MVEQVANNAAALLAQLEKGFHSPFGRLGKELEKAAFVVIHCPVVDEPRSAINNPGFRPIADTRASTITAPMEAREAARRTLTGRALRRSLIVALVVGTALNLINQGPELLAGDWPVVWKLLLTYLVPFLVASYGSYAAFRSSS